jgi:hypothetical protein
VCLAIGDISWIRPQKFLLDIGSTRTSFVQKELSKAHGVWRTERKPLLEHRRGGFGERSAVLARAPAMSRTHRLPVVSFLTRHAVDPVEKIYVFLNGKVIIEGRTGCDM